MMNKVDKDIDWEELKADLDEPESISWEEAEQLGIDLDNSGLTQEDALESLDDQD